MNKKASLEMHQIVLIIIALIVLLIVFGLIGNWGKQITSSGLQFFKGIFS